MHWALLFIRCFGYVCSTVSFSLPRTKFVRVPLMSTFGLICVLFLLHLSIHQPHDGCVPVYVCAMWYCAIGILSKKTRAKNRPTNKWSDSAGLTSKIEGKESSLPKTRRKQRKRVKTAEWKIQEVKWTVFPFESVEPESLILQDRWVSILGKVAKICKRTRRIRAEGRIKPKDHKTKRVELETWNDIRNLRVSGTSWLNAQNTNRF